MVSLNVKLRDHFVTNLSPWRSLCDLRDHFEAISLGRIKVYKVKKNQVTAVLINSFSELANQCSVAALLHIFDLVGTLDKGPVHGNLHAEQVGTVQGLLSRDGLLQKIPQFINFIETL